MYFIVTSSNCYLVTT